MKARARSALHDAHVPHSDCRDADEERLRMSPAYRPHAGLLHRLHHRPRAADVDGPRRVARWLRHPGVDSDRLTMLQDSRRFAVADLLDALRRMTKYSLVIDLHDALGRHKPADSPRLALDDDAAADARPARVENRRREPGRPLARPSAGVSGSPLRLRAPLRRQMTKVRRRPLTALDCADGLPRGRAPTPDTQEMLMEKHRPPHRGRPGLPARAGRLVQKTMLGRCLSTSRHSGDAVRASVDADDRDLPVEMRHPPLTDESHLAMLGARLATRGHRGDGAPRKRHRVLRWWTVPL